MIRMIMYHLCGVGRGRLSSSKVHRKVSLAKSTLTRLMAEEAANVMSEKARMSDSDKESGRLHGMRFLRKCVISQL